jgi:hypothetical protein
MKKILKGFLFAFVAVFGLSLASCSEKDEHSPVSASAWQTNETAHWQDCSHCEDPINIGYHAYNEWTEFRSSCYKKRTCVVCGYIEKQELEHEYSEWEIVGPTEGCYQYARTCKHCGSVETKNEHINWTFDSASHWIECNSCGDYHETAIHTYSKWVLDAKDCFETRACVICGFTQKRNVEHNFVTSETPVEGETCVFEQACSHCKLAQETTIHNFGEDIICDDCGFIDIVTYYLKGGMNGWSNDKNYELKFDEATMSASITVFVKAGVEFKVADENWAWEFGAGENGTFVPKGGNIKLETSGVYKFTVSKLNTVNHELTIEAADPIAWYVKGGMNGWAAAEAQKLAYDAATDTATITLTIEKGVEFKVADPDWSIEFNINTVTAEDGLLVGTGNISVAETGVYVITITDANTPAAVCTIAKAE